MAVADERNHMICVWVFSVTNSESIYIYTYITLFPSPQDMKSLGIRNHLHELISPPWLTYQAILMSSIRGLCWIFRLRKVLYFSSHRQDLDWQIGRREIDRGLSSLLGVHKGLAMQKASVCVRGIFGGICVLKLLIGVSFTPHRNR